MFEQAICDECEWWVEEYIPTDRGLKRGEYVCRLNRDIETCDKIAEAKRMAHEYKMEGDR
jgi:hypothetical protein